MKPLGYVQIIDLSSAQPLAVPEGAVVATIIAEGAGIRYRTDGTAPTASVGMPVAAGTVFELEGQTLRAAQIIQQAAGAILNVSYFAPTAESPP